VTTTIPDPPRDNAPGREPGSAATGVAADYLASVREILARVEQTQGEAIERAAQICAASIAGGGLVHVFGSGHSRMIVEEIWPRYGSFPGFHPIVELSLTAHHQVTGANGQRQAMFIERTPGLAAQILRNFHFGPHDALIAISSGGTSVVTVELAEQLRARGLPVIAFTSREHSLRSAPQAPSGRRLMDAADIVLDTCTPVGDATVRLPGLQGPVGPTTTVAAAAIANAMKARVAELLVAAGQPPHVLASPLVVGAEASTREFQAAYDEHARRVSRLYLFPADGT
jgi:uncharacterized phosphosugar-binding protein